MTPHPNPLPQGAREQEKCRLGILAQQITKKQGRLGGTQQQNRKQW